MIFNSCSHGGADTIIREVTATFPDKKVKALIGGFHLYNKTDAEILALAEGIRSTGISEIYTGHCTGLDVDKLYMMISHKKKRRDRR